MDALQPSYAELLAEVARLRMRNAELETALAAPVAEHAASAAAMDTCGAKAGPTRVPDGAITVYGHDITAWREAQQALEYERQQLAAILNTMREGVIAVRPDGTVALMNPAALRLREFDPLDAPTTLNAIQPLPHQFLDAFGQPIATMDLPIPRVLRGECFSGLELRQRSIGTGDERWHFVNGTPVYDEAGKLLLGVITVTDITDRKLTELMLATHAEVLSRTNAELSRALRLKEEFLTMMSHELRTPLNIVLGVAEALQEELYGPTNARQQQALERISAAGKHLLGILSDILELTRIEAGAITLEIEALPIEHLCRSAFQSVAERARKKEIRLVQTVMIGARRVWADERRLIQILASLLDNAVKFTPAKGTVGLDIEADASREQICFTIWDTGIGIAAEDMDRLFRPFTQIDGRLARLYEGIGLGLTLAQRLTELHGGSIQVASVPGMGSRFTVTLPWTASDHLRPQSEDRAAPQLSWEHPPRVLVADDHEPTLELYAKQLTRLGCTVLTARSGAETLKQIQTSRPELVLLDLHLPDLDGLTLIRGVRADVEIAATPIAAMSALSIPGDRERYLEAGATAYVTRPIDDRTLATIIARALADPGDKQSDA